MSLLQNIVSFIGLFCKRDIINTHTEQVSFAEYSLFCRAVVQKGHIILRSLLIVATPYCKTLPKSPIFLHQSPTLLRKSPINPPKSLFPAQKSPASPQKKPRKEGGKIFPPKGPMNPQNCPIFPPKSPVYPHKSVRSV